MQQTIKPEASSRLARHLRAGLLTTDDPRKIERGHGAPNESISGRYASACSSRELS